MNIIKNNINVSTKSKIVTICQMRSTNNKQFNQNQIRKLLEESKKQNSSFVFLPECCDYVGTDPQNTIELSEDINGDTITFYQSLAKQYKIWLSIGGFHEAFYKKDGSKEDKMTNSHIIIDDNGKIITIYRKLHLFDVDTPEFKFRESNIINSGMEIIKPIETPIGLLGLMICYDLRFPELSSILRKQGAQILTYPSAFSYSTGQAHWETLLKCRAIENQCYVIASAQIGFHNDKRQSYGHAMVIDPNGNIIGDCGENELCAINIEIDLEYLKELRTSFPFSFRNDIYSLNDINSDNQYISKYIPSNDIDKVIFTTKHCKVFKSNRIKIDHILITTNRFVNYIDELTTEELLDFNETIKMEYYKLMEQENYLSISLLSKKSEICENIHCYIKSQYENDEYYNVMNCTENILFDNNITKSISNEYKKFFNWIYSVIS